MRGLIYTEFMELVEARFGAEVVDEIILRAGVEGAYTSVGAYPHGEMIRLITALSTVTGAPAGALSVAYGEHLLKTFVRLHPQYFGQVSGAFELLESVDTVIHREVEMLDREARPPRVGCVRAPDGLRLTYRSHRPFADVAEGLIRGTIQHFSENIHLHRGPVEADGSVTFELRRADAPS